MRTSKKAARSTVHIFLWDGAEITKEDLDAICPDAELQIQETEGYSIRINSKRLASHGITDGSPARAIFMFR